MLAEEDASRAIKPAAKTILIVEDDEDNFLLYREILSTHSQYHIHLARNSTEALAFVEHIKPDLYILDYRLPQMNGIDLYDHLHVLPGLENVPTVLITAASTEKLKLEVESRKLIHLDKPFELDEFVDIIKQALAYQ
jgi:CheY-like chemotaxis protein